jgi:outer membrane protein TolC
VGTLPPLDLVLSEATIASRQVDIINARTAVGNASDQLRLLLNIEQGPVWEAEIVAETDARTSSIEPDLAEAIKRALAERPELARQRLDVERLQIEARFARNQVLPLLNLGLSYGYRGLGGDVILRDPETNEVIALIPGGYGDALDQIRDRDFDTWTVSLLFAMPLQNRAAKAAAASAGLEADQGAAQLTQLQQQVVTEVRAAVRQVLAAAEGIRSAEASRRLQEKNLQAEQKRYENGMSTSFQVTQIQEDLTQARSVEVTAIASYRRALTEYYRAIGQLLEQTGVELIGP